MEMLSVWRHLEKTNLVEDVGYERKPIESYYDDWEKFEEGAMYRLVNSLPQSRNKAMPENVVSMAEYKARLQQVVDNRKPTEEQLLARVRAVIESAGSNRSQKETDTEELSDFFPTANKLYGRETEVLL